MKKYVLFIKETCPYCVMAVELLEEKNLEYDTINVNGNVILAQQVKNAFNWNTFPIVLEQENDVSKLIGGFDSLEGIVINDG